MEPGELLALLTALSPPKSANQDKVFVSKRAKALNQKRKRALHASKRPK